MAAASLGRTVLRRSGYVVAAAVPSVYVWQHQQESRSARMHESTLTRTESRSASPPSSASPEQSTTSQQKGLKTEGRRPTGTAGAVGARNEEVEVEADRILQRRRVQLLPPSVYESVELEVDPSCPLCRLMRASPCAHGWTMWERCVKYHKDRKEDFADYCGTYTLQLAECVTKQREHFPPPLLRSLGVPTEDEEEEEEEEMWDDAPATQAPPHTQQTQHSTQAPVTNQPTQRSTSEGPVSGQRHEVVVHEGERAGRTLAASLAREGEGEA